MSALPWPARIYLGGLTAVALLLAAVLVYTEGWPSDSKTLAALGCAGLIALAWMRPFPLSFKRKLYLDTTVLIFVVLLFEPGIAMVVAGVGTLASHAIRKQDRVEGLFNSVQIMLQAAAGSLVLAVGGYEHTLSKLDEPLAPLLILIAGLAMYLTNSVIVSVMVALQSRMSVSHVLRRGIVESEREEQFAHFAQIGLGSAAATLALAAPWMILLLSFPIVAIYFAVERNVELRRIAETRLKDRAADLAEAQRIAKLGSWQWDLDSGRHTWSAETYRLLGVQRDHLTPSFEALMASVHPDDRRLVDGAVHAALHDEAAFSIEHRICTSDGEERIVHHRGEVILDNAGNKIRLAATIQDITERKTFEAQIQDYLERDRVAAELAEGRRRLARSREHERLALAREVHDGPVQDLLAITYNLAAQRRSLGNSHGAVAVADTQEEIRQDILGVVAQLRGLVGEMRPPGLTEFGLAAALEGYISEVKRHQGLGAPEITLTVDDLPVLSQSLALTAFRIVQEALRNALRHANASMVTILLDAEKGRLHIRVADDGEGFPVPDRISTLADNGHFGLIGLVERVDLASGTIEIESGHGAGTTVHVWLPVTTDGG